MWVCAANVQNFTFACIKAELPFVRTNTYKLSKSFWSFSLSYVFATGENILVSSANMCVMHYVIFGRSFMNIINSNGPRTLPCGIPLVTGAQSDLEPLTTTR